MKTMDFGTISTTWALLDKEANILILTEEERLPLAQRIKTDNLRHVAAVRVIDIGAEDGYLREMQQLTEKDLLIVLLTMEGFMKRGYRNIFFVCLSCFYHGNGFRSRIQLGIHKNLTEKYFPYKIFLDRKIGAERFRKNMYSVGSTVI